MRMWFTLLTKPSEIHESRSIRTPPTPPCRIHWVDQCIDSRTCNNHHTWILGSFVSSGWKLVPNTFPCRTATILPSSPSAPPPGPATATALSSSVAKTSTSAVTSFILTPSSAILAGAITVPGICSSSSCGPSRLFNIFSTTGARMNTPLNGSSPIAASTFFRKGSLKGAWKLSTCRPK